MGTSVSSTKLSNDLGRCIIEGICTLMCLSMVLCSSTGSISGDSDSILVTSAST